MPAGTIKKLVQDKGFGFISTNEGTDVFFHHSTVADAQFDSLEVGQKVDFTLDTGGGNKGGKGPRGHGNAAVSFAADLNRVGNFFKVPADVPL